MNSIICPEADILDFLSFKISEVKSSWTNTYLSKIAYIHNINWNLIIDDLFIIAYYKFLFRNTHLHLLCCSSGPVLLFQKWLPGNQHQRNVLVDPAQWSASDMCPFSSLCFRKTSVVEKAVILKWQVKTWHLFDTLVEKVLKLNPFNTEIKNCISVFLFCLPEGGNK